MAKLILNLQEQPEAASLQVHKDSPNTVQVEFSDKTKSLVSLTKPGYFDGKDPLFLDEDNKLSPQFERSVINGTSWIVKKGARSTLSTF